MDNWLKGLIATASTVIIVAGGIWIYDRCRIYLTEQRIENVIAEETRRSYENDIAYAKKISADVERSKLEQQRIAAVKSGYFERETAAKGSASESCFASVRKMYEFGGTDALYTMPPNDIKVMTVRKCISDGIFTEQEVALLSKH